MGMFYCMFIPHPIILGLHKLRVIVKLSASRVRPVRWFIANRRGLPYYGRLFSGKGLSPMSCGSDSRGKLAMCCQDGPFELRSHVVHSGSMLYNTRFGLKKGINRVKVVSFTGFSYS